MSVLSAFELNTAMVEKSREVDLALDEYRRYNRQWAEAENVSRKKQAQAYAFVKGKTVPETRALIDLECDEELSQALLADVLRNSAKEALRARMSQLSALQSMASALREELRFGRTGPDQVA